MVAPPGGGQMMAPPGGGQTMAPPGGGQTVAPPGGGRTVVPRVEMRRVIPSYRRRTPLILGVLQIVFGVLILLFGITNIAIKAFVSAGGSSFLAALGLFACGTTGIVSSRNKEVWAISLYMLLSVIAVIFNVTLVAASGVGVLKETQRTGPVQPATRESIDLVLCVLGVVVNVTLVWSVIMCSMTLFYGCCKQHSGVRYVPELQVRFTPEPNAPDPRPSPNGPDSGPAILPDTNSV